MTGQGKDGEKHEGCSLLPRRMVNQPGNSRASDAKMKITDIVAVLHKAATDMQAFAARNDDLNLPDEVVLPFIINFLTDERLRKLSADGPSGGFEE